MGHQKGEYKHLHPNDDVELLSVTNDAYPTAIKLAVIFSAKDTVGAMAELQAALEAKATELPMSSRWGAPRIRTQCP